jgi:hypothetical protein
MDIVDSSTLGSTSPRTWALYAGVYMFVCAAVVAVLLSDILALLADVIGLPAAYWPVIVAGPAFGIGAVAWWTIVERRASYTYRLGAVFGGVTALLTGLLWTGRFILVWSVEMAAVPVITYLIAFVVGVTAVAGVLTSIPLMYVRRQFRSEIATKTERTA